MELNREQVIKGLQCCADENSCEGKCPYYSYVVTVCSTNLAKDALDLINELTEENERLTSLCVSKDVIIGDMNAENERLRAENKIEYETPLGKQTMPNLLHLEGDLARLYTQIKNETKADTVRKMQDAVAVHFGTYTDKDQVKIADVFRLLDQIANEMLEGNE